MNFDIFEKEGACEFFLTIDTIEFFLTIDTIEFYFGCSAKDSILVLKGLVLPRMLETRSNFGKF